MKFQDPTEKGNAGLFLAFCEAFKNRIRGW